MPKEEFETYMVEDGARDCVRSLFNSFVLFICFGKINGRDIFTVRALRTASRGT
jgi:hypothetical protein